jgi:predicted DCC family thiol-disulfide oxidoreductase YuxK
VNDPRIQARYGVTPQAAAQAMHLVLPGGRVVAGAAAVRVLLRRSRWAFPLAWAWYLPGVPWLADRAYRWVAAHRYLFLGRTAPADCTGDSCAIHLGRPRRPA